MQIRRFKSGAVVLLVILAIAFTPSVVAAQATNGEPSAPSAPPAPPAPSAPPALDATGLFPVGASEWMVMGGTGWGVRLFNSAGGHQYIMQTVSWGRVLSNPRFNGVWRGRFEWAFEGTPIYAQYQPNRVFGVGIAPLVWRWNFEPRGRYAPYAELAGGALWTSSPVPQRTTSANFTAHLGAGVRMLIRPHQSLVLAYRFDHISNGNRLDRNPGVNAHVLQFGLSLLRPPQGGS